MTKSLTFFLLPLTLGLVALHPAVSVAQEPKKLLSETEALTLLVQQVKADALYEGWTKIDCLSFVVEETTLAHVDMAIREKHGGQCPGDPNTAPVVDRFRVVRAKKIVLWYDPLEDEYVAYERGKEARKK